MAAGDNWFNCAEKNIALESAIRLMVREDANGNPCFTTNSATVLEPYLNCESRKYISTEQLLKLMIIEDANGDPMWNVSSE